MQYVKVIETPRLILSNWRRDNALDLFEYAQDPEVGPSTGWKPHEVLRESKEIIKKVFIPLKVWKISLKEDEKKAIGSIGYYEDKRRPNIKSKELGYSLGKKYWGKGIMTEAARAVLEYGFSDMKLDIIAINTSPENERSLSVINKLGFKFEGTERYAYRIYDNTVKDIHCFSMFKEEWIEFYSKQEQHLADYL